MSTLEQFVQARCSPMHLLKQCYYIAGLLIVIAFGSVIIFLFQLLISYDPSCSVQNFYVPALNKFLNSTQFRSPHDSLIFFDLELKNAMDYKGVHYDAIDLTFSYATNTTSIEIGNYTVPSFYQGKGKKAQRRDVAIVTGNVPWKETAMMSLSNGSAVAFRMNLTRKVKFKLYLFNSGKRSISVGGSVEVDDSGKKVERKPVNLKSGAAAPPVAHLASAATLLVLFLM